MDLRELLKGKGPLTHCVTPELDIVTAIRDMHENKIGSVLVTGADGLPVGIFTERDVMRLCAQSRDWCAFDKMSVGECMTAQPVCASPDDSVEQSLALMTERRFRHLPVVEDGAVLGVVSIGDLVKAKLDETAFEAQALREYITT